VAVNKIHVLVPCAGSGQRAGASMPKQYQPINGQPMVLHTLKALSKVSNITSGVVVVSPQDEVMQSMLQAEALSLFTAHAVGGLTRAQSVLAGLEVLQAQGCSMDDWVLVHDAARCVIQPAWIEKLIDACENHSVGGILAWPVSDTLKLSQKGAIESTLDRSDKWLAQTPQMFRLGSLMQALNVAGVQTHGNLQTLSQPEWLTDEASALEAIGGKPLLVAASALNLKVTYPEDFILASHLLRAFAQGVLTP
jgi:2-C-methyl-D-erythritol 4-phosphate cytidylyltransferase